jgi:hypothetical protein
VGWAPACRTAPQWLQGGGRNGIREHNSVKTLVHWSEKELAVCGEGAAGRREQPHKHRATAGSRTCYVGLLPCCLISVVVLLQHLQICRARWGHGIYQHWASAQTASSSAVLHCMTACVHSKQMAAAGAGAGRAIPGCRCLSWRAAWETWGASGTSPQPCRSGT